ncbi:FAD-dependent monooxygenase [Chryseolinea sp. T2]|uniref:FAD-dependent monooxygenase n=1 Tax=Chryseolinea sp. T2 TaxID=3129255 RepID=UPI0030775EEE
MNEMHERPQYKDNLYLYDVIISGGGPVGLFLACELALTKCTVLVLEKSNDADSALKKIPFGIRGLSAPSVEALHRRGLLTGLDLHKRLKNPHASNTQLGPARQVGHFAGIPFLEGNIDSSQWPSRLASSTPASLLTEMNELELALNGRAIALGVEIRRGVAVDDFIQTQESVTVQSGDLVFKAKWLVGCDGSRSVVRKQGDFGFAGTEPEFTGYSVQADIVDPEKLLPGRNLTAQGMYLQSQPGYLNIQDFDSGAFHDSGKPITLEHVQAVLRRVSNTDVTIGALRIATTWTDRSRQATSYRKGRVFLAGDAAHIHSPLGGQGLNLGLGDAMNLGWKLAANIHGYAPEGLLDTYESERSPVGAQVLDWSRAQVAIMRPTPHARALNAIIRDLVNTRDGATYMAGRVWGIQCHYDLGGSHPLVGYSVPNFEFEDGSTIGELMHDGCGIILDFTSNASLRTLANEFEGRIKYISGSANWKDVELEDPKDRFGIIAALIRPDGMVAWAASNEIDDAALRLATGRWFIKNAAEHSSRGTIEI